jgi:hypothetical protein
VVTTNATPMPPARHSSTQASSVTTITGLGDHDQPEWLITMTGIRTLHPDKNFIHVPLVPWPWTATSQAVGETRAEFLAPASYRLVGEDDAALSQYQLHIPRAEAEHVVQPDRVTDDLGGEPMAELGVGLRLHAASLARLQTGDQSWLP